MVVIKTILKFIAGSEDQLVLTPDEFSFPTGNLRLFIFQMMRRERVEDKGLREFVDGG